MPKKIIANMERCQFTLYRDKGSLVDPREDILTVQYFIADQPTFSEQHTSEEREYITSAIGELIPAHLRFEMPVHFRKIKKHDDPDFVAGADTKQLQIIYLEKYSLSLTVLLHEYGHLVDARMLNKDIQEVINDYLWKKGAEKNRVRRIYTRYYESDQIFSQYLIGRFQKYPLTIKNKTPYLDNSKRSPRETRAETFMAYIKYGDLFRKLPRNDPAYMLYEFYRDKIFLGIEYEKVRLA
ncbi:hypothetical protein ACFL5G_02775 [Candidatus Margulisiibacteriota bacterium]